MCKPSKASKITPILGLGPYPSWTPLRVVFTHEAKLYAVIFALKYARKFQWTYIWIECDSTYVVDLLPKLLCFCSLASSGSMV